MESHLDDVLERPRRFDERLVDRCGAVPCHRVEPRQRVVVERVQDRVVGARGNRHVGDQHRPLRPVVERHEVTDDREHRVGPAPVVGGDIGQVLDLTDNVVAHVADDAAVEGWEIGIGLPSEGGEERVERVEHPAVAIDVARQRPFHVDGAVTEHQAGQRAATDEGPSRPTATVIDRFKEEPGLVTAQPGEDGHRRDVVGEEFPPDRHHSGSTRRQAERRPVRCRRRHRTARRRTGRSSCRHRCDRRRGPPVRRGRGGCRRRSRSTPRG